MDIKNVFDNSIKKTNILPYTLYFNNMCFLLLLLVLTIIVIGRLSKTTQPKISFETGSIISTC